MNWETWPPLLVVDVEGNGQSPPDLVEIATMPISAGTLDRDNARTWLVRPPRPITGFATRVHGITNPDVADAAIWNDTAADVETHLGGAWIAAHNAAFVEYRVLTAHLPGWAPAGVLDTLRLSRTACADASKHNLDAMITHTGIDTSSIPGHRHRAAFDAAATALLLLHLASRFDTFDALAAVSVPPGLPGSTPTKPTDDSATLW